jgi:integrase
MPKITNLYHMRNSRFWWYRWCQDGKRHAVSLKTEDMNEALEAIKKIKAGEWYVASMKRIEAPSDLSKLVEKYISRSKKRAKKPMRPGSAVRRSRALLYILRDMGITSIDDLTPKKIESWLQRQKEKGKSADTVHTYAWYLRAFVRDLIAQRIARHDLDKFDIPERAVTGRKNWLRLADVDRVIAASTDPDLTFILYSGFKAGLRKSEILAAKVGWFDLDAGLLHMQNDPASGFILKDRENRAIPLSPSFRDFLRVYLKDRKGNEYCLEPAKNGGGLYRFEFRKGVMGHFERCGVKCTLHDMRRSFASNLVSEGKSIYKVARWLGDNVAIVERSYGYLEPADSDIDVLG